MEYRKYASTGFGSFSRMKPPIADQLNGAWSSCNGGEIEFA